MLYGRAGKPAQDRLGIGGAAPERRGVFDDLIALPLDLSISSQSIARVSTGARSPSRSRKPVSVRCAQKSAQAS
jgi:hypothetical protein